MDIYDAVLAGNLETAKSFIESGSDVNEKYNFGWPLLSVASFNNKIEIVRELIKAGADLNATDNGGWTALMSASINGCKDIVNELVNCNGIDIDYTFDYKRWNALMYATKKNYHEIVDTLVNAGSNIYLSDYDGLTALSIANDYNHKETINVFKKYIVKDLYFLWPSLSHDIIKHIVYEY